MANPKKDKIFAEAVHRAVKREYTDKNGKKSKYLEKIVDKLVKLAAEGESWAMQEVANRLDGRPMQSVQADIQADVEIHAGNDAFKV